MTSTKEPTPKPTVTVILPAYNEEQVVGETVRAIKELHPDFEVLVVDDGSTDNTIQAAMDAGANVCLHYTCNFRVLRNDKQPPSIHPER